MKSDNNAERRLTYHSSLGLKRITPRFRLITGGVCAGKSTYRNSDDVKDYVQVDAGDIFITLSKGEYYDFPSHLEDEINRIGIDLLNNSIRNRQDIVMEIVGSDKSFVTSFVEMIKSINYKVELVHLSCDVEEAVERNEKRSGDNVSAHFYERYHLNWLENIINKRG